MSFVVSYDLGPYFNQITIIEIMQGPSYFKLHFDETLTVQVKTQMDLLVKNWFGTDHEVKVKYLTSIMFGHTKADVFKEMLDALEKLEEPLRLMLSLGMDGQNVNKSFMGKLNKIKKENGYQELVRCPTSCLIHVCHNIFMKGIIKYGCNAEELCLNLYYFFKKSSC